MLFLLLNNNYCLRFLVVVVDVSSFNEEKELLIQMIKSTVMYYFKLLYVFCFNNY